MKKNKHLIFFVSVCTALSVGCAPRLTIVTGTTIGMKTNTGNTTTSTPSFLFGYRRGELALIPTAANAATKDKTPCPAKSESPSSNASTLDAPNESTPPPGTPPVTPESGDTIKKTITPPTDPNNAVEDCTSSDAYSTLAVFHLDTEWMGKTNIRQFLATGHAARDIQGDEKESEFAKEFLAAREGRTSQEIKDRQDLLKQKSLSEDKANKILNLAGYTVKSGKTAQDSLKEKIDETTTDSGLMRLESAFERVGQ